MSWLSLRVIENVEAHFRHAEQLGSLEMGGMVNGGKGSLRTLTLRTHYRKLYFSFINESLFIKMYKQRQTDLFARTNRDHERMNPLFFDLSLTCDSTDSQFVVGFRSAVRISLLGSIGHSLLYVVNLHRFILLVKSNCA